MNNRELQDYLATYPGDLEVKLLINGSNETPMISFTDENILHSSETAFVDDSFPEDEWDAEDGKINLGEGKQYLLINPIIY